MIGARTEKPFLSRILALGLVLALMVAGLALLTSRSAHADTTFTVNTTNDLEDVNPGDGVCAVNNIPGFAGCTLRAAIQESNATEGADTISFNIGGGIGLKTIRPESELPDITEAVTIDGYTQPGASENTQEQGTDAILQIELDGENAGEEAQGLDVEASNSVIRGLVVNRFGSDGISISDKGDRVEGNFIGTDASGTQDLGNGANGVRNAGKDSIVGGASPEARNLISGNGNSGVTLAVSDPGNQVLGNLVGTEKDGTSILGNDGPGVSVFQAFGNTIGGDAPGAGNAIAFNGADGVQVLVNNSTGNRILGNSIFSNGDLGIDLGDDGPTANDPRDGDEGPNNLQNFPVLTSATASGGTTAIEGTLDSTPSKKRKKKSFTIQLFFMPSGEDEGKTFLGETKVKTNKQGIASFTFSADQEIPAGEAVTATATDSKGNTSEFSDLLAVSSS